MKPFGLMGPGVKPLAPKPMVKAPVVAKQVKAPKAQRLNGTFQSAREKEGKLSGGGSGEVSHPTTHAQFESLGHK